MRPTFVIVGAGLAGWSAASSLRAAGFSGRVVLIGEEPELPYDRPPLSKEFLRGEATRESAMLSPPDWYETNQVELRLGSRVEAIRPRERRVALSGGDELRYDRLLIATGGQARELEVPGNHLAGIMHLRSASDATRIRDALQPGLRICIVGGGFIGLEVAAAARHRGLDVTVVEALQAPLARVLGTELGQACAALHLEAGVRVMAGSSVAAFEGQDRLKAVRTSDGDRLACDLAVVGVGIEPRTRGFAEAGVKIDDGVLIDRYCETSVEGIYAAGDVARQQHPLFGWLRVEHWQHALRQGATAARNMMGTRDAFDEVPWFWSDQYEHNLQYAGVAVDWDDVVVRGDLASRSFLAFYLSDGRVTAAFALNCGRDLRRTIPLIRTGARVPIGLLADQAVDLRHASAGQCAQPTLT